MSKASESGRSSYETMLAARRFSRRTLLKAGAAAGAAVLRALRKMETEGIVKVRSEVGGGLHSGEHYVIRLLGEEIGGLFTLILKKTPAGWRVVHDHTSG